MLAAITGVGETTMARSLPDRTPLSLACEAAILALADAGVPVGEVDGILTFEGGAFSPYADGRPFNPRGHLQVAETLGIDNAAFAAVTQMGGATPGFLLATARAAVLEGRCRHVLVVGAGKMGPARRSAGGRATTDALASFNGHSINYEQPFGPLMVTYYAAVAQRHMYEFGTTPEQLAAIAVACRRHASLNPNAVYRDPITVADVLTSRMISSPLRLLDCCVASDGGSAWVVSSERAVAEARSRPVWILGCGYAQSDYFLGALCRGAEGFDLVRSVGSRAGAMAFGEAGVTPAEIDVAEIYDSFTICALMGLEDFGFCAKGEGGPFAAARELELGGRLPLNTHGGLLSGQHFGPGGVMHYTEAVRQLRGEGGRRQVEGARLAFAGSIAGVCSTYSGAVLAAG
ncbi:MAG: thiolase family protein [Solirubrobacterales bacterium]